ncbi:hypothetical protein, partial [Streptomyces sp. URMC 129]|uniref:hypothetical protein n=1 Tax=Streptomyces sp. URMC 129 TaxID=3423407 RepID=UPI003F1E30E5
MHHDDAIPPIQNYDGLPTGEIAHRIKSLSPPELDTLLDYEHTHADRPAVTRMIESRRADLSHGTPPTKGGGTPRPGG